MNIPTCDRRLVKIWELVVALRKDIEKDEPTVAMAISLGAVLAIERILRGLLEGVLSGGN